MDIDLLLLAGDHLSSLLCLEALESALVLVKLQEFLDVEVYLLVVRGREGINLWLCLLVLLLLHLYLNYFQI